MALLPENDPPFSPFLSPEEAIPDFLAFPAFGYGVDMPYFDSIYPIQKGDPDEEICALLQFSSKVPSYEEVMNLPPSLIHHPTSSSSSSTSTPPPLSPPLSSSSSSSSKTSITISTWSSHENGMPASSPPSRIGLDQIVSDASLHHNTIPSIKNCSEQPSTYPSSKANPSWSRANELMPKDKSTILRVEYGSDSTASLHNASSSLTNKCTCRVKESNEDIRIDGYKWRKYGKKILKSSPFERYPNLNSGPIMELWHDPESIDQNFITYNVFRSYYRCNFLKCPARKYVDCSFDFLITVTSYEGTHDDLLCFRGNSTHVHRSTRPWNN